LAPVHSGRQVRRLRERVDGVGLGEASPGLREVADLAWIDDHDRQAELGESGDRGRLDATGRFQTPRVGDHDGCAPYLQTGV
jgi:hypothetical protein